jgi:hypothetical protein
MDTASKILLSVLIISIIISASFYTYYLNSTNLPKIFETLFSENPFNNVNVYHWYHDVYVYIPQRNDSRNNTEQPIVFKGQANASVYIFGYNANREWTVLAYGESNAEAFGNGTYYAHIEYDLYLPRGAYTTPITVLAGITFREIEYKGNKIENVTRWAALHYQVFVNPEGYLYVYNIAREEYFNKINKIENQYLRQNLDDIISKVALPYCLDVTNPELELICSIIDEEARAVRDYLNRYNLTFYVDEHTVKVYLNFLELDHYFAKIRGEGVTEQSTINSQSQVCFPGPKGKITCVEKIYETYFEVPFHLFTYYGARIRDSSGETYSVVDMSYILRSFFDISASIGVSGTLGLLTFSYKFGTSIASYYSQSRSGFTLYRDETLSLLVYPLFRYQLWRMVFKQCFLWWCDTYTYSSAYVDKVKPTSAVSFGEDTPSLPEGWNECSSCYYKKLATLYNSTNPRIGGSITISNFYQSQTYYTTSITITTIIPVRVVYLTISASLTTEITEAKGLAREITLNVKFYDNENTKKIQRVYLCDVPIVHYIGNGISYAYPKGAVSWCVCARYG